MNVPDLLNNQPQINLDETALEETLSFAFVSGRSSKTLEEHLNTATVETTSSFDPQCFSRDLFVDEFVEDCFTMGQFGRPLNLNFLTKILTHPPTDPRVIRFRQNILKELVDRPDLADQLEALYRELWKLAQAFNTSSFGVELDLRAFRMDVMTQIKKVVDIMSNHFQEAISGLSRIYQAGIEITGSEEYKQLADLLDYEAHLSKIDLQIRIGASGDLKGVKILKINEHKENQYFSSPLHRVTEKLKLWFRGYHFSDYDLISRLIQRVFSRLEHCFVPFVQLIGHVEFYLCALNFRKMVKAKGLDMCLANIVDENHNEGAQFSGLFNPLLFRQDIVPSPCNITNGQTDVITLITGPNSGGKTRLLQALGLSQLLGQSGLFVPAKMCRIRIVNGLFVSLIEEDGLDQQEGRLGSELKRIRTLFEKSCLRSMVILDELCSGTNPSEGAEIVALVLKLMAKLQPQAYITTHFLDFANNISRNPSPHLEFYQVELNQNDEPTYGFIPGVANSSLARKIAARLGVTREQLLALIRQKTPSTRSVGKLQVTA